MISLLIRAQIEAVQGSALLATRVSDGVRERRDLQSGPNRETTGPILTGTAFAQWDKSSLQSPLGPPCSRQYRFLPALRSFENTP
ncbi:MAG: hypothetical protein P8L49_13655 [Opitutaceae bacterium]|nr:hypothetical protein [Opitutaceae bacterium]